MTPIDALIADMVRRSEHYKRNPLGDAPIDETCTASGLSRADFNDAFAEYVAREFVANRLAWEVGDAAMNNLFGFDEGLSGFAWKVYLAFDEGEYLRERDPPDIDHAEVYTRPLVLEALASRDA